MHKKRVEVWESTMILLAFFLVKILYGVSGAIREDITQHGITVGPGGGRKINQQAQCKL